MIYSKGLRGGIEPLAAPGEVDESNKHRNFPQETVFVSGVKPKVNIDFMLTRFGASLKWPFKELQFSALA